MAKETSIFAKNVRGRLYHEAGIKTDQDTTDKIIKAVCDTIATDLSKGNVLELPEVGKFSIIYQPERTARNPQTGEALIVEPKMVLRFKIRKSLKDSVSQLPVVIPETPEEESSEESSEEPE